MGGRKKRISRESVAINLIARAVRAAGTHMVNYHNLCDCDETLSGSNAKPNGPLVGRKTSKHPRECFRENGPAQIPDMVHT